MSTYTVTAVGENVRDWNTQKGVPWKSYRVTLKNSDGRELENVEVSRPATAPKPAAGETVEGTVDQTGNYGPKLKEDRKQGGGGGFRGKTPAERREIAMQVSEKVAVDVVRVALEHGQKVDDVLQRVLEATDALYERVQSVEGAGS